ncbi:MAG: sugar transferase [Ignavibacteriaceae bacterium]|nr:sugar transferase [Ignavibacteriaceae bacterium]
MKSFADKSKISIEYLIVDGFILTLFCYYGILLNLNLADIKGKEYLLFAVIYIGWLISAATTNKFIPVIFPTKRWKAFEFKIKFYVWFILLIVVSMIFVNIQFPGSIYIIKTIIGYTLLSSLVSMIFFVIKKENKTDDVTLTFLKAYELKDHVVPSNGRKHNIKYAINDTEPNESVIKKPLQFEYLEEYVDVFSVLDNILDFKTFDTRKAVIIKYNDPINISLLYADSYQLIVNLHFMNDQNNLNKFLYDTRSALAPGGVFVGMLHHDCYRYSKFLKKYYFLIGNILYCFYFIWKRIFPKLPVTRELYWTFSKGKNRAISLAEGLGRLIYSGFKILDIAALDDIVYLAAVKDKAPIPEKKNFYSLFFKMKRIGKGGKTIYVYKLRTMHPYSEYIQDFVYELNGYGDKGKIKDDFRVASWGKFLRKYWLDELPMLINVLKGDLKLVGVRPLSCSMFNQYPPELQKLRIASKPGLVPPFYYDLPVTFNEILESEKKYLLSYERNPVKTDIKYFFKCWYNIIVRKARSS